MDMRAAVVAKSFAETYIVNYLQDGFTEDECVDTVAKQFKIGKKATRELVREVARREGIQLT